MAEVFKKSNSPYWYADYTVGGKRHRPSTKRRNKREAKRIADSWERTALDQHQHQHEGGQQELTVREALQFYIDKHASNPRSDAETRVRKITGEFEGIEPMADPDLPFHELTSTMMRQYVDRRLAQGAAKRTVIHEINAVSAAYHIVAEDYRVRQGLKFPRPSVESLPRPLLDHEVDALLEALDPNSWRVSSKHTFTVGEDTPVSGYTKVVHQMRQQNYDLVVCLLDTGCRLTELTKVTWDLVDTDHFKYIHIFRTKNKDKSATGRRRTMKMPLTRRTSAIIKRRFEGRGSNPYVFPAWEHQPNGKFVTRKSPQTNTSSIRKKMNMVGINSDENVERWGRRDVRSLRDTFATRLRQRGAPLEDVQEMLGHSTITMTQKYADAGLDDIAQRSVGLLEAG